MNIPADAGWSGTTLSAKACLIREFRLIEHVLTLHIKLTPI